MQIVAIFIFLHIVKGYDSKNDNNLEILSPKGSFIRDTNLKLDNATKDLFNCLKLEHNYTMSTKMKTLTFMHQGLRNVSEANFKEYNHIINMSKATYDMRAKYELFNFTKIIEDIFEQLHFNDYAVIDIFDREYNSTNTLFKSLKFIKHYNSSEGIVDMIKFFLARKDSNILQPIKPKNDTGKNETIDTHLHRRFINVNRQFRKSFYKLRPWRPISESSEFNVTTNNRRIYKGKKVPIHRYSFIVSIHLMGEFMCSGSIVSKDLIITSASCLQIAYNNPNMLISPDVITVRAGTELTRKGGVVSPVIEIHFHPKYDPVYLEHNLALARIAMSVTFRSSEIKKMRRIEFETKATKLSNKGQITILGWGDKDRYTQYVGPLTMGRLDVYDLKTCKEIYTENYVHDTNFCAGFINTGGGACKKDQGGPGLVDQVLVGVVNFGPPVCGTPDAPTVFTRIGVYTDWIQSVIKKVLQPPHKKPQPIFRHNTKKPDSKEKLLNEELVTLKKLFIKYVKSGIVNISQLMAENIRDPVTKPKPIEKSENKGMSKVILVTMPETAFKYLNKNRTEVLKLDGESKSNSLTIESKADDGNAGGLSIEIPEDRTTKPIEKLTVKKYSALGMGSKPTTTNSPNEKQLKETLGINTAKNLYPWGTERIVHMTGNGKSYMNRQKYTPSSTMVSTLETTRKRQTKTHINSKLRLNFDSYNDDGDGDTLSDTNEKDTDYTIKYIFK